MKDANGIECLEISPAQQDDDNNESSIMKMIDDE